MKNIAVKIPIFSHERFFKFISIKDSGCWEWKGFIDKHGYGKFTIANKCYFSHRVSYDIFTSELCEKSVIDHICKNRACCNPDHLRPVSVYTNVIENSNSFVAVNKLKTHCLRGHELVHPNIYTHDGRRRCKICNLMLARQRKGSKK